MELLIALLGLVGSWFLFAGAVYQASLELTEEELNHEHFDTVRKSLEPDEEVSPLWWFLPPVKLYLEQRRARAFRARFITQLSAEDVATLVSFLNKASGWLVVAGGAWLLAVKETLETSEVLEGAHWMSVLAIAVMTVLGLLFTVLTSKRSQGMLAAAASAR